MFPEEVLAVDAKLLYPKLSSEKAISTKSRLAAVSERLASFGNASSVGPAAGTQSAGSESASEGGENAGEPAVLAGYSGQPDLVAIEPPIVDEVDEDQLPNIDPASLAQTNIEPVGSSPKKAVIPEEALKSGMTVAQDGRVFGKGSDRDKARDARAIDGSPLRSYEVQKFEPALRYKTIASTKVVSAPSVLSHTMAELRAGTPVHVSAKLGTWFEIRAADGRAGYIYTQNAEPE